MYKIIIWGTGNTAKSALQKLGDNVELIGFLDNHSTESFFQGYKILDKAIIKECEYEYIVICSIYFREIFEQLISLGIKKEKILVYSQNKAERYWLNEENFFEKKWRIIEKKGNFNIFISGISYHNDGIDENVFWEKTGKTAFNFALRGQDLYYDWQIAMLLDRKGYLDETTHYVIGLNYYSFEYDMTKSVNAWEIIRYYPFIKDSHNLASTCSFDDFVCHMQKEIEGDKIYYELFNKSPQYHLNEQEAVKCAKGDFNKNYPITVWENKAILKKFIQFLIQKNIKPIIVIMPAVEAYVNACPCGFKDKFYMDLAESLNGENVQILDYFGTYYGDIQDWYHVTHFNKSGARKFTEHLVNDILW